jgi:hypothetical protein
MTPLLRVGCRIPRYIPSCDAPCSARKEGAEAAAGKEEAYNGEQHNREDDGKDNEACAVGRGV